MVPVKRSKQDNPLLIEQDTLARQAAKVIPFGRVAPASRPAPITFEPAHVPFRRRSRQYQSGWFDLACFLVLVFLLCCVLFF